MAHPYHHAVSSAIAHGGVPSDYLEIHSWFDQSKRYIANFRHRALRHHTEGIFECERVFGVTIQLSTCKRCGEPESQHPWLGGDASRGCLEFTPKHVPVRAIGEQHVQEDLGFIPTLEDWLKHIDGQPWMNRSRRLSKELDAQEAKAS